MPEYNDTIIEEIAALAEMAEEAALCERGAFGYVEPPEMHALWDGGTLRNGAIAEHCAGVFGERW